MAVPVQVDLDPNTRKVEAALARIKAQAKGIDFGGGASSIEKLSRPLGKITGQASEFQKSLEASNARVLAFGASVAVINKLSEAFGALVSNTIKVEASFAKINTILGGTQKQLEQFGNGIFKVAQQTGTSFDQVSEGALELARQGLSVEESLSRVETALKLVRVSGIDAEKAVGGLTAAIKGFEGAGLSVAQIADKLAEVDTKFAVSTEDLINGLERASASARVAGVSFDELLGVVTTVQERTQRGGAVIGNAFKTIFARLGRTDTLTTLQDLGISVLDTEGNVRGAIPLFKELAVELDKLGLKSVEAGDIIQKVAGVRQRDILISLVEDLNSGQSQFAKSLEVSATAAGALDSKNSQLNQTLEALINNLAVGSQKLSSVLGELGFTDAAKDILKAISSVVNGITDLLQGEGPGAKFAQGIIKGIGSVLTGPGVALIGAIFIKLFVDLAKFGATSLKQILGINRAAAQQATLQQSVLQTLLQNENIQREILALEGNKVAQEQLLLKIYNQQAAALARVQKAAATVTPGLFKGGFRGGEGGVGKTGRASGGYVAAEARDVSRGVGGAPASSKVVSIPNFAFGGGQRGTMVANTSEYIVPNFAGGGDAIFNRDMVRSMGLPAGARKINAAGGYVPNFATKGTPEYFRNISRKANPTSTEKKELEAYQATRGGNAFNAESKGVVMLVPQTTVRGTSLDTVFKKPKVGKKGTYNSFIGKAFGIDPNLSKDSKFANLVGIDGQLESAMADSINTIIGKVYPSIKTSPTPPISAKAAKQKFLQEGGAGAFGSFRGAMFEAIIEMIVGGSNRDNAGTLDVAFNSANRDALNEIFGLPKNYKFGDYKNSVLSKDKFINQAIANRGADGYIPNFAGGALEAAVAREQAAGLPINQIRINQSGKLRNAQNPMGLAVTNTRDEPTGAIPNFFKGGALTIGESVRRSGGTSGTVDLTKSGDNTSSALEGAIGKIFALQLATSALTNTFTDQDSIMGKFGEGLNSAINTLFVLSATGASPLGVFGKGGGGLKSIGGLLKGAKSAAGALNLLKGLAGPVALGFTAINTALKMFTGKGIFQRLGEGFGILATESQKAAKKINEATESLQPGKEGAGVVKNTTSVVQAIANQAIERSRKESLGIDQKKDIDPANLRLAEILKSILPNAARTKTPTFNAEKGVIENLGLGLGGQGYFRGEDRELIAGRLRETLFASAEEIVEGIKTSGGEITKNQAQEVFKKQSDEVANFLKSLGPNVNKEELAKSLDDLSLSLAGFFNEYLKSAEEAVLDPNLRISTLSDSINLAKREGEFKKFEGFELANVKGGSGVPAVTAPKNSLLSKQIELEIKLSGQLGQLERERLRVKKELLDFEIKTKEASRERGANLATDVAKLLEGKAVLAEQEDELIKLVESGKSYEDILTQVNELLPESGEQYDQIKQELDKILEVYRKQNIESTVLLNTESKILQKKKEQSQLTPLQRANVDRRNSLKELEEEVPKRMADNLENSLATAIDNVSSGAYDSLGDVFLNVALDFGRNLQQEMSKAAAKSFTESFTSSSGGSSLFGGIGNFFKSAFGKNAGGLITGGSGVRDDVPAVLTGGEYVVRKSAVQKYGVDFLDKLNSRGISQMAFGGAFTSVIPKTILQAGAKGKELVNKERTSGASDFFVPGTRGQGAIGGKKDLLSFANQEFTSGSTDIMTSSGSGAFIDLEDQSVRLSTFGRFRDSPARKALKEAQGQALDLYNKQLQEEARVKAARKARKNQLMSGIVGSFVGAGVNALAPSLGKGLGSLLGGSSSISSANTSVLQTSAETGTTERFLYNPGFSLAANGGQMSGKTNSLLMGGEYVVSAQSAAKIGRENLDSINMMNFSNGGSVGSVASSSGDGESASVGEVNITINMEKGDATVEESSNQGGDVTQTKEFAKKVKDVVVGVINEEKRVSGSLFSRRK